MDKRMMEFVHALRASGVRVSLAESEDACRAAKCAGVFVPEHFRSALRLTLVKDAKDIPAFEWLFPIYFGTGTPPPLDGGGEMEAEDQRRLADALRHLAERIGPELLRRLLAHLIRGRPLSREELDALGKQAGLSMASRPEHAPWMEARMQRAGDLEEMAEALLEILAELAARGTAREALQELSETAGFNRAALKEQIRRAVGEAIVRKMREEYENREPRSDVMNRPFRGLGERDMDRLREEVRRLASRLRSRASLRHRRAKKGKFDIRRTLRKNLRYGAVPIELHHKRRVLKPKIFLVCDVSTSVRHCAEFMLTLIYELQDQVARARCFAFIDRLVDISHWFKEHPPQEAVALVLDELRAGYYNTDLGASLAVICRDHLAEIDPRTTVIFLGDGRNNFNDPRLDCMEKVKFNARRVIWMNPEARHLWETGDSDMPAYLPYCDVVYEVGNLAQLSHAVDRLFGDR